MENSANRIGTKWRNLKLNRLRCVGVTVGFLCISYRCIRNCKLALWMKPTTAQKEVGIIGELIIRNFNPNLQAILVSRLYFYLWTLGTNIDEFILGRKTDEIPISIFWLIVLFTIDYIISLPFTFYFNMIIQTRYGLSKYQIFIGTLIESIIVYVCYLVVYVLIVPPMISLVKAGGQYFPIYLSILHLILILLVFFFIVDVVHSPRLSRDFRQLEDGELKTAIKKLASRVNFPLTEILIYEASKNSNEVNAYFLGLTCTSKKIVLFDTLVNLLSIQEVVAVVAHELGHWKKNHTLQGLIVSEGYLLLQLVAASYLFQRDLTYNTFDFFDSKPVAVGYFIIFNYIFIPLDYIYTSLFTSFTRYHEYQADAFAVSLGLGRYLRSALIKIGTGNIMFPVNDWLFSIFTFDHPPLLDRLKALPQ